MINKEALELIKRWEGLRLEAYPDPGSKNGIPWTIGYGHTKGVKKGMKITREQAEAFLIEDLKVAEDVIKRRVKVHLNENQYGALVSFIHNLGEKQFVEGSVDNYINDNKLNKVPDRLKLYNKNDGKVMKGLVDRRADEIALWNKPVVKSPQPTQVKEEAPVKGGDSQNWFLALLRLLIGLFKRKS